MADFSDVSVNLDGITLTLTGQASSDVDTTFNGTATVRDTVDGSTQDFTFTGTRQVKTPEATVLDAVTDDQGGTWTVAEDGQTATSVTPEGN